MAQAPVTVTGGTFTLGGVALFATDFSQDPIGSFPTNLQYVRGGVEVVAVNGVPMLRAISPTEFLIPLGTPLPQDFTLEFDLIARDGAGNQITFEGGPNLSASASSAQIGWGKVGVTVQGGGLGNREVRFSADQEAQLVGQRASVQVMMSGTQFKGFTNGQQILNIPTLAFRRASVLRITLGADNDAEYAMHLAGIRLAANGVPAVLVNQPGTINPITSSPPPPPPLPPAPAPAPGPPRPPMSGPIGAAPATLAVLASSWPNAGRSVVEGSLVVWSTVSGATAYRVYRQLGSAPPTVHLTVTSGDADAVATAFFPSTLPFGGPGSTGALLDPLVDPMVSGYPSNCTYWVDAAFPNGTSSGLSPSAVPTRQGSSNSFFGLTPVPNVTATIGPSTTVSLPGGGSAPGRNVTWSWGDPAMVVLVHEVTVALFGGQTGFGPSGTVLAYEPVLGSKAPIINGTSVPAMLTPLAQLGIPNGPPYTGGIPSGITTRFCVTWIQHGKPSNPQAASAGCLGTVVP